MTRTQYISTLLLSLMLAAPAWAQTGTYSQGSTAPRSGPPPLYVPRSNDRDVNARRAAENNAAQQRAEAAHNGDWLRHTMQLPPREQERALEQDPHFRSLPPRQQDQLRTRLRTFNTLPPSQRQRVLARMEMMDRMNQGQQQQTVQLFNQFRALPPTRQAAVRQGLRRMRPLPPATREAWLNSPEARTHFTPYEIQIMRGLIQVGGGMP
jgi:hypothetical protein